MRFNPHGEKIHVTMKLSNSKPLFCFIIFRLVMNVNDLVLLYYLQRIDYVDTFISKAFAPASERLDVRISPATDLSR